MIGSYCPPVLIKKLFDDFIWQTTNNKILLTFDDGPTEKSTPIILESLNKHKIKAAFFCVGENIQKYTKLTEHLIDEGHLIANHTMQHKLITKISSVETAYEISSFNKLLMNNFNYVVKYFRPPHGRFNLKTNGILKNQKLKCVMWSLLSHDYKNDFEKLKNGIDKYLCANSIIVFHDNIKSNPILDKSLNYTIDAATKKGYQIGEPEDCLK
ncbi:MAG: polysaccharide deacetylase family protein [Ignavibacteria bacterium]|nr:polysaccharide deacetylase family protein [Ignavibacteria bacterium]MBT8383175.1 polysaccharide deacetylase family protein [Ignavibacteria bacterium]MBT8390821.1 polysaccharide deacetylase family protein [Ignavibacteria bacterium]NNJ53284.1 polysaccharide deacetylase family protein [Ignavibacteriaceae bacterium]NNL20864.1 polysaccharide deacetylase family protein [Ignavibacteriaceae bacterium]